MDRTMKRTAIQIVLSLIAVSTKTLFAQRRRALEGRRT